jgi:hypothetical protein
MRAEPSAQANRNRPWHGVTLLSYLAALIAGLALIIVVFTPLPGSGDYGQWLMASRYYLGQPIPEYRDLSTLLPLIPASLALVRLLVGDPIVSLRVFDVILVTGMSLGYAFLGLSLFRNREAAFASVLVALLATDRMRELFAFGGLVQAGAVTLTLFSYAAFVWAGRGQAGSARWWWLGSVCLGFVALAHVGTAAIAVPTGVGIAFLSFLRSRHANPATSPTVLAPLAVVLLPLVAFWLVVLVPADRGLVSNPASLNYRGPEQLWPILTGYWPNRLVLAVGLVSLVLGASREAKGRVIGPYLIVLAWTAASLGFLLYAVVVRAATDYPRFAYVLFPPFAAAATGGLAWLARWLALRLVLAIRKTRQQVPILLMAVRTAGRDASLILLAALAVVVSPFAVERYNEQSTFYSQSDPEALERAIKVLDNLLPTADLSVLDASGVGGRAGKWLEGLTGRAALSSQAVRYLFRPGEWQRSIDAQVLQDATAALTNEFFLVEYTSRETSGVGAPVNLVIAANHGGEFVKLLTLAHGDTRVDYRGQAVGLSSLSGTGVTSNDSGIEASIRTEWREPGEAAGLSIARTVRLVGGSPTLSLTDEGPFVSAESIVLNVAPGIAITHVETTRNEATVCFTRRGRTEPCLRVQVSGPDGIIERDVGGGLLARGGAGGMTELQISALSAGGAIVGLELIEPLTVVAKYSVGAAIVDSFDPDHEETLSRLGALGFHPTFEEGRYGVLLRTVPVAVK